MEESVTEVFKELESGNDVVVKCSECGDLIELKAECFEVSKAEFSSLFPCEKIDDTCRIICDECYEQTMQYYIKNN